MFHADSLMLVATARSAMKKNIQVEVSQRLTITPTATVINVSAAIWTVDRPANGNVDMPVQASSCCSQQLSEADVYLFFTRYYDFSACSRAMKDREAAHKRY